MIRQSLVAFLLLSSAYECVAAGIAPIELKALQEIEEHLQNGKPLLLEFYSSSCSHCRAMAPRLQEIAQELPELTILKVEAKSPLFGQLQKRFEGHGGFPTFIFIDRTGKKVHKMTGAMDKAKLKKEIQDRILR